MVEGRDHPVVPVFLNTKLAEKLSPAVTTGGTCWEIHCPSFPGSLRRTDPGPHGRFGPLQSLPETHRAHPGRWVGVPPGPPICRGELSPVSGAGGNDWEAVFSPLMKNSISPVAAE